MLIARNGPALLFGFARSAQRPSYGFALKLDPRPFGRPCWRNCQIGVYGPAQRVGRGCWTFEAATWRSFDQKGRKGDRVGVKAFVRIKIGLGGDG